MLAVSRRLGLAAALASAAAGGCESDLLDPDTVGERFIGVAAGQMFSCGIVNPIEALSQAQAAGRVLCWGENDNGQLGDGTTIQRSSPVPVQGAIAFGEVRAGEDFACGLASDGRAFCWGDNSHGQLGDGTTVDRTTPTPVTGGHAFASLGLMSDAACGLTAAGAALCWGENADGQLGDGSRVDRTAPVPVQGGHVFRLLATAGGERVNHMCGITTANALLCWGDGANGQIGDQATLDRLAPTVVAGGPAWVAAGLGSFHSCGVTQEGNAQCWGGNAEGQLGDGSLAPSSAPRGVGDLPGPMTAIAGGEGHSCAIAADGAAFCWGGNDHGQLGNGSRVSRTTAVTVVDGHAFVALASGEDHVCGLRSDGRIFCWGENDRGQLGIGSHDDQSRPVRVEG